MAEIVHNFVGSSTIATASYDTDSHVLIVGFHSGNVYKYYAVEQSRFSEWIDAVSAGTYFNKFIAKSYKYDRIK